MRKGVAAWSCAVSATLLLSGISAAPARADEVWVGLYGHDAIAPDRRERGEDLQVGYRTARLPSLGFLGHPSIDALVMFNSQTSTHFAAAGLDWRIGLGHGFYIRPGFGLAYTTGKAVLPPANGPGLTPAEIASRVRVNGRRIDFGSKVLFKPELAVGYSISPRWAVEASYVHFSNGQVFHKGKNQGLDDLGARLVWRFGAG